MLSHSSTIAVQIQIFPGHQLMCPNGPGLLSIRSLCGKQEVLKNMMSSFSRNCAQAEEWLDTEPRSGSQLRTAKAPPMGKNQMNVEVSPRSSAISQIEASVGTTCAWAIFLTAVVKMSCLMWFQRCSRQALRYWADAVTCRLRTCS